MQRMKTFHWRRLIVAAITGLFAGALCAMYCYCILECDVLVTIYAAMLPTLFVACAALYV